MKKQTIEQVNNFKIIHSTPILTSEEKEIMEKKILTQIYNSLANVN